MVSNAAASPNWARRMASLRVALSGLRGPHGLGGVWLGSDKSDLGSARSLTRVRPRRAVLSGAIALPSSATLRELFMESQAIRCSVFLIQTIRDYNDQGRKRARCQTQVKWVSPLQVLEASWSQEVSDSCGS